VEKQLSPAMDEAIAQITVNIFNGITSLVPFEELFTEKL
jgi:hypothetical protein